MSATKGYYSVIQYCPDASRLEAANIGILLLCPALRFVSARMTRSNDRIRRFFQGQPIDLARVNAAKKAIERRLEVDRDRFQTPEDLTRFIDTRGNDIVLTQPRAIKILDAEADLDQLFQELVGGRSRNDRHKPEIPELDRVFRRESLQSRVLFDQQVSVPVINRPLRIAYTYRNSVTNLVRPQRFAADERHATSTAMRLAIEGSLLHRHPIDRVQHKLIVVSAFDQTSSAVDLQERIDSVLSEYDVRVVHSNELGAFAAEVEAEAH